METESSLPCSKEPAPGPYPEPDASNPHVFYLFVLFIQKGKVSSVPKASITPWWWRQRVDVMPHSFWSSALVCRQRSSSECYNRDWGSTTSRTVLPRIDCGSSEQTKWVKWSLFISHCDTLSKAKPSWLWHTNGVRAMAANDQCS